MSLQRLIAPLTAVALTVALTPLGAAPRALVEAHEVLVEELLLGAGGGQLTFRDCRDCPLQRLRLGADVRYFENDRELGPREARSIRRRGAVLSIDVDSGRVLHLRVRAADSR